MNFKHIQDIDYSYFLDRPEIRIDFSGIDHFFSEKSVLITGGCGSIGSEIVRQLLNLNISNIIIYDNSESNLFYLQQEISKITYKPVHYIIGDVRDISRLNEIFSKFKPHIVYHAAAYKHVPMMEHNPIEAIKTNLKGTRNVALISSKYEVERFIMISSDKAVNPTNIMGASKKIAEIITQEISSTSKTIFITTRFSNVLGSIGSVIPTFINQALSESCISVTHPDVTRYFLTIPEAAKLVLISTKIGDDREILLFNMGNPIKIIDLAKKIFKMLGITNGDINFIGLRPGEKLYEELLCTGEKSIKTSNENIMKLKHPELNMLKIIPHITNLIKMDSTNIKFIVNEINQIIPNFKTTIC